MAEIKNTFLKSKMNKDLDARLLPPGEYRHAQNININKSEGADVGAIENVLGNIELIDFKLGSTVAGLEIIGVHTDVVNNRIFCFITNYRDSSANLLSNFASNQSSCWIYMYDVFNNTYTQLVAGSFLNFSKTHPILGIDVLEDFLFFTDNRNQPRKINISSAMSFPATSSAGAYYTNEDQISVAKYYPFQPLTMDMKDVVSEFLPASYQAYISTPSATTNTFTVYVMPSSVGTGMDINPINGRDWQMEMVDDGLDPVVNSVKALVDSSVDDGGGAYTITLTTTIDIIQNSRVYFSAPNPDYDSVWGGDEDFLKERFPRFSYRFKFDDNEYSLLAPFTAIAFIPERDGYVQGGNTEGQTIMYENTINNLMQNKVNQIALTIPTPSDNANLLSQFSDILNGFRVKEIDIIYKEAGTQALRVVETITAEQILVNGTGTDYIYTYNSSKPIETLPESDLVRVSDIVPLRAYSQAIVGNRVVYANYTNKNSYAETLGYGLNADVKFNAAGGSTSYINSIETLPNHQLKQNRTYKVGVVLSDRYGRQTGVIPSSTNNDTGTFASDTFFHSYTDVPTGGYTSLVGNSVSTGWFGDSLKIKFYQTIPTLPNGPLFLYGSGSAQFTRNITGWYSYKIVVQQQEQEYYNVYYPGFISGGNQTTQPVVGRLALSAGGLTGSVTHSPSSVNSLGTYTNLTPDLSTGSGTGAKIDVTVSGLVSAPLYSVSASVAGENYQSGDTITIFPSQVDAPPGSSRLVITLDGGDFQDDIPLTFNDPISSVPSGIWTTQSDNINKVPADLKSVGPEQKLFRSSQKLDPRVSNSTGTYTTPGPLTVTTSRRSRPYKAEFSHNVNNIGTAIDQGLWTQTSDAPSTIYRAEGSSPLMAITETDNINYGVKGSLMGSPFLAIYETQPVESLLDIYWETSSSGIIGEINTNIGASSATMPFNIETGSAVTAEKPPVFELFENATLGSSALISSASDFLVKNSFGNQIVGATITLLNVTDGLGNDRTADFVLQGPDGSGKYFPKTAGLFYFGSDANIRESYKFTFLLTNPATGETTQYLWNAGSLSNIAPSIGTAITPCGGSVTITGTASGNVTANTYLNVLNGSADTNADEQEITGTVDNVNFTITRYDTPWPRRWRLEALQGLPLGTYNGLVVRFSDAGGLRVSCTIDVTVAS